MEPITREEMYLAAAAGYDITPPEPITRKEFFLAKLAGMDVQLPATFSREEMFLDAVAQRSPAAVIEALNVTENGVYTAGNGVDGYSPVTVDIPDPVLQDKTITENGTYKADEGFDGLGEVTVEVAGNGGLKITGGDWSRTANSERKVIEHNLGVIPDLIAVFPTYVVESKSTPGNISYFGCTKEVGMQSTSISPRFKAVTKLTSDGKLEIFESTMNGIESNNGGNFGIIAINETSFTAYNFNQGCDYTWYAIAGLT